MGGEVAWALAAGAALVVALTFPFVRRPLRDRPRLWPAVLVVPVAGIRVWDLAVAWPQDVPLSRLQAQLTMTLPALLATAPLVLAALVLGYLRASSPWPMPGPARVGSGVRGSSAS